MEVDFERREVTKARDENRKEEKERKEKGRGAKG